LINQRGALILYLISRQLKEGGLTDQQFTLTDEALSHVLEFARKQLLPGVATSVISAK